MPKFKKSRVPAWKKKGKKMYRRKKRTVLVNRALHPIPQRFITKMKYSETVATTAGGNYQFNLNDIFDPNRTGVGHQPYGHDTLQTLYNRYRVISCGYRITWNAQTNAIVLGAMPANEVILFTSTAEMRENPRARYGLANAGGNAQTISGKVYLPSLVGRNKAQYMADDRYQAQFGSSPSELAILNIATANNSDTMLSANIQVLLEYTVECFDMKHLAQS